MFSQFKSLPHLYDFFPDEKSCIAYWTHVRWNGNIICPHCSAPDPYLTNRGYKCTALGCQKKFSALVGSIFENTKLPLRTWFSAIFLCCNHKKGISSLQLAADLAIPQRTAWFLLHRIRELFKIDASEPVGGEGVVVEADTTMVGGKAKNMHMRKRNEVFNKARGGSGLGNKIPVAGYLERGSNIRMVVIKRSEGENETLVQNVHSSSALMTDSASAFKRMGEIYAFHGIVDHARGQYVKDKIIHTNSVEGAFSHFDRTIIGTYHKISAKHMQAYANEFAYRYNTRKMGVAQRFDDTMMKCVGARLKFKDLVADTEK